VVLTRKQFGRMLGRSPACITKWCKKGMPVEPAGGVDYEKGVAWAKKNILGFDTGLPAFGKLSGPGAAGAATAAGPVAVDGNGNGHGNHTNGHASGADTSYARAVREKVVVQTERERVKLARERGSLISETEFQVVVIGVLAWFCSERRILPARLRDELAHKSEGEVEVILAKALAACQMELCRRLRVDPSEADSLGAAWLRFYEEWQARATGGARS
jgi:hypothetical protein